MSGNALYSNVVILDMKQSFTYDCLLLLMHYLQLNLQCIFFCFVIVQALDSYLKTSQTGLEFACFLNSLRLFADL